MGLDGNVLSLNLYDKGNNYRSQISSFGIVSSPPTLTRLRTDADGDPTVTIPAYSNFGAASMGYSNPGVSALGLTAFAWQGETNRYSSNAPEGRSF